MIQSVYSQYNDAIKFHPCARFMSSQQKKVFTLDYIHTT